MMRRIKDGFTFIELIIGITIFSIIAISIYSTLRAGTRVWLETNSIIGANQAIRIFFDTAATDLKNSIAYTKDGINFEGESKRLSFMTKVNSHSAEGRIHTELARVVYYFDEASRTLKRAIATKAEGLDENKAKAQELLKDIEGDGFGFKYCYKPPSSEIAYDWKESWLERDRAGVPAAVKVRVGELEKTVFIPTGVLGSES